MRDFMKTSSEATAIGQKAELEGSTWRAELEDSSEAEMTGHD
jgi:hypothetical protein